MLADIHILRESEFYTLKDFRCKCTECSTSKPEVAQSFTICFVRSGYFEQQYFRQRQEVHVGRVLISKPGIEYVVHHIKDNPDLCTAINFTPPFYERLRENYGKEAHWFFTNPDLHSLLLIAHADIDFLHHQILHRAPNASGLEMDELIIKLVDKVFKHLGNTKATQAIPEALKRLHLPTVEKARDYILKYFKDNIGLHQLADHSCVSVFHFSRIFKAVMRKSPYQYLNEVRLHHAHLLLETTTKPIAEIALLSGFQSPENFNVAFTKAFATTPGSIRVKESFTLRSASSFAKKHTIQCP